MVAESSTLKRKRPGDEEDAKSGKKPRKQPRAAGGQIMPPPGEVPAIDDDVQCGYYAIERFRATWQITHVSGIFLTANFLNLLWYDPQGCIQSTPIDIVRQLPLLVLLVQLQQRSDFWSGWPNTTIPQKYRMVRKCAPRFQLVGRMTSCADLTTETGNHEAHTVDSASRVSGMGEAKHHFKSSWPEDVRPKEAYVIKTAQTRARQFLSEMMQQFVLDHLPRVHDEIVVHGTCTAIIRVLLGLSTQGSRTQYLMFSEKLSSVRTIVHEYESFKRVFLQIIRAHRLLWVLGIAHSDISFHNLMLDGDNGILNDFDLASIMEPGETSPPKIGHLRTGTPMFMSVEVLTDPGVEGFVPRMYRHDLESFAWVLLYATHCVINGEENLNVSPFRDWVGLTSTELLLRKLAFLLDPADKVRARVKGSYQGVLLMTLRIWRNLAYNQGQARLDQTEPLLPSDESLLTKTLEAWGSLEPYDWINFKNSHKDTAGSTITGAVEDPVEESSTTNLFTSSALSVVGPTAGSLDQADDDDIYA